MKSALHSSILVAAINGSDPFHEVSLKVFESANHFAY